MMPTTKLSIRLSTKLLSEKDIDDVAGILFIGEAVGGLLGEVGDGPEVVGYLGEELHAGLGIEAIPSEESLESDAGLLGRDPLAETSGKMGMLPEGVELARCDLLDVRLSAARRRHLVQLVLGVIPSLLPRGLSTIGP